MAKKIPTSKRRKIEEVETKDEAKEGTEDAGPQDTGQRTKAVGASIAEATASEIEKRSQRNKQKKNQQQQQQQQQTQTQEPGPMTPMKTEIVMPYRLLEIMDAAVEEHGYLDANELINDAVRRHLGLS